MLRKYFLFVLIAVLFWNGILISAQEEGCDIMLLTDAGNVIDSEVEAQCTISNLGDPMPEEAHIFVISFDPTLLRVNTEKGINGVEPLTPSTSLEVDTTLPGAIKIEVQLSSHQNFFILHFEPLQTGVSSLAVTTVIPDIYSIQDAEIKIVDYGDVNGDFAIDIIDALEVAQKYVGISDKPIIENAANVNCDEDIDIIDALLIAQYYVQLIDQFPLCGGNPTQIPNPTDTATPAPTPGGTTIPGDVNCDGKADMIDCLILAQYIEGLDPVPFCEEAADINGDGVINALDVMLCGNPIIDPAIND